MKLEQMLEILRCPKSGSTLELTEQGLSATDGKIYPLVAGKPILVRNLLPMHLNTPEARQISQNSREFNLPDKYKDKEDIIALHLGSGNVPCYNPRVISMDILPNENVDLVAEAEALPFADNSIDFVFSDAVFEHLYDPLRAIKEVKRVLKENCEFTIGTAFMQGYHGFPGHYFNMTPQAVETYIIDDFILEQSAANHPATVFNASYEFTQFLLENIPDKDRKNILNMPLGKFLELIKFTGRVPKPFGKFITEHMQRSIAASFTVTARKPANYDIRVAECINTYGADAWASVKREYFAARMGAIIAHGGVNFWRMRAIDDMDAPQDSVGETEAPLDAILKIGKVLDTLDPTEWRAAINRLKAADADLVRLRDLWIREFLVRQSHKPCG
jgi:SAM-dependent methyltransferase